MKQLSLCLPLFVLLSGCQGQAVKSSPATAGEVSQLKSSMDHAFYALEMYAADNSLAYPDSMEKLKPKYLDESPRDPVSRQDILYKKTPEGFFLEASGDYSAVQAEPGYPKMNQNGFFVKKASEFPKEVFPDDKAEASPKSKP